MTESTWAHFATGQADRPACSLDESAADLLKTLLAICPPGLVKSTTSGFICDCLVAHIHLKGQFARSALLEAIDGTIVDTKDKTIVVDGTFQGCVCRVTITRA